jgi:hypothetical protein
MNKILKDYHYMLIIDAGIKINGEAHTEGVKRDIFIKDVDGITWLELSGREKLILSTSSILMQVNSGKTCSIFSTKRLNFQVCGLT